MKAAKLFGRVPYGIGKPRVRVPGIVTGTNGVSRATFLASANPNVKITIGGKKITTQTIQNVDSRIIRRPKK